MAISGDLKQVYITPASKDAETRNAELAQQRSVDMNDKEVISVQWARNSGKWLVTYLERTE